MNYYVIDSGEDIAELAVGTFEALKKLGNHVVLYCTDQPNEMTITIVDEDEFLDHFKKFNDDSGRL
jgi:hypothetical protein